MRRLLLCLTLLLMAAPAAAQDTTAVLSDRQLRQRLGWDIARAQSARADIDSLLSRLVASHRSVHARIVRDSLRAVTPEPPAPPPPPVDTTPAPPPPATWRSNEPAGFVALSDNPIDAVTALGWSVANADPRSDFRIVQDAAAPVSAPNVLRTTWPQAPASPTYNAGNYNRSIPSGTTDLYLAFAVKLSAGWSDQDPGLKYVHIMWGTVNIHLDRFHPSPAWREQYGHLAGQWGLQPTAWGSSIHTAGNNVNATAARALTDRWQVIEIRVRTGAAGMTRLWVDGVLTQSYDGAVPAGSIFSVGFSHVYGGGSRGIPADQYTYLDHVYISRAP